MKKIEIIDEANPSGNKDNLGIELHTNSLIKLRPVKNIWIQIIPMKLVELLNKI